MFFFKYLYDKYRNIRSKFVLNFFRIVYYKHFIFEKSMYVRKAFMLTIEDNGYVSVGARVFFNNNCSLNSLLGIEIGSDCIFGENVHIYDHDHVYLSRNIPINQQGFTKDKVIIEKNCWIGSNVTILKGVTIGEHSVIGAGCVVNRNIPPGSLVVCCNTIRKVKDI